MELFSVQTIIFSLITLGLIRLTWQDCFNDRNVDHRQVYFIMGGALVGISIMVISSGLLALLFAILYGVVVSGLFSHFLELGVPDNELINYLTLLFTMYSLWLGVLFVGILLITSTSYLVYNRLAGNSLKSLPRPFLPVLMLTWLLTNLQMFFTIIPNLR